MMSRFLSSRRAPLLGLLLLCLLTLFLGSGRVPFYGPDEPRYAEVAREMWANNDYISPRLAGRLWLEKPPLLYWGQAFFYSIFGPGELAARLPSAFGALFVVFLLYSTAKRALGARAALYVGVVCASMLMMIVPAHGASTDMPLCAMFAGAFLCLWRSSVSQKHGLSWALSSAAFVGGAMLAKGLIGPLFYAIIGGIWWLWSRPISKKPLAGRLTTFGAATLVFLAVSAIWYAPVWMRHGQFFYEEFFVNHHFKRFTSNLYEHRQPFYFYLFLLPIGTLPWTPWLLGAARDFRALRPRLSERDSLLAFAWVWAIIPIAFFSKSGSKLPFYILPSFPAIALLAGDSLSRGALLPRGWKPKWVAFGGATFMALLVLVAFEVYAPLNEIGLSTRALCLKVASQMKPGERATFLKIGRDYNPVFYLQGRIVPGTGKHDTFVAESPAELLPLLKNGSLIVFAKPENAPLIEKNADFAAQLLGTHPKMIAYRLTRR